MCFVETELLKKKLDLLIYNELNVPSDLLIGGGREERVREDFH